MTAADVIDACRRIAGYSTTGGATTRLFLSPPMRSVHRDLTAWMQRVGMAVHIDAAGNLRGTYAGSSADAPRLFIGSHLDTVAGAGAFDGVLGVVLGIVLVESLNGERLPFAIEVVGFSEEEGVRFGIPFIGSRAFTGTIDGSLLAARDDHGISVADAIRDYGLPLEDLDRASVAGRTLGYLEFHIEQGPVLEQLGVPVGVVEAIAGQSRIEVTFIGAPGHAGTTPMAARRDALAGAAEWIGCVERVARETAGLVATVGRVQIRPGVANVIAGRCTATLDVRHATDRVRADAVASLGRQANDVAVRRHLTLEWAPKLDQPAVAMDAALSASLARAVGDTGAPVHRLSSGAGHDAMIVAARMPAAVLFIRSPGGIGHSPEESVLESDVSVALAVGQRFLRVVATDPS